MKEVQDSETHKAEIESCAFANCAYPETVDIGTVSNIPLQFLQKSTVGTGTLPAACNVRKRISCIPFFHKIPHTLTALFPYCP